MKKKHTSENKKFDATFHEDLRKRWLAMIRKWERDESSPNPYTHTEKGISTPRCDLRVSHVHPASNLAEVRRKLAEADEADIRRGTASYPVPGSVFVRNGLEIEEQQYVPLPLYINYVLTVRFILDGSCSSLSQRSHRNLADRLPRSRKSATLSCDESGNGA